MRVPACVFLPHARCTGWVSALITRLYRCSEGRQGRIPACVTLDLTSVPVSQVNMPSWLTSIVLATKTCILLQPDLVGHNNQQTHLSPSERWNKMVYFSISFPCCESVIWACQRLKTSTFRGQTFTSGYNPEILHGSTFIMACNYFCCTLAKILDQLKNYCLNS